MRKRTWPGDGTPVRFWPRAEVEPLLFAPQAEQHCELLEFDRPDHDAAMDWLLASGAAEDAQRLAAALYFFWYTRGLFVTGLRWLRAALSAEGQVEPMVRLRAEVGLAQLAFIAGDYMASFTAIESAVPTARLLGDDVVLARCLATAGYVWWLLDPDRSAALFEEGLEAAHRGEDGWTRSTGLAGLGWARYFAGRFDAAADPLRDAIELTARSGRRQQFAMAVLGRAAVELWRGQLCGGRAAPRLSACWTQATPPGPARRWSGPRSNAHAAAWKSWALSPGIGSPRPTRPSHRSPLGTSRILLAEGDPGRHRPRDQGRNFPPRLVWPPLAWWLDSLGELAELEGRHDDARSWYELAGGHAAESGLPVDAARARHHRARLAWLEGDQASAVNGCQEALARQLNAADQLGLVETLETLGGVLVDERSARRGLPLLAAASAARDALGFPWRPAEASRIAGWIATGRGQLGEQAEPAWARGAGLGIEEAAVMARRGRGREGAFRGRAPPPPSAMGAPRRPRPTNPETPPGSGGTGTRQGSCQRRASPGHPG
jgi:hypothetical protein